MPGLSFTASLGRSLRHRNYRLYLTGQLISVCGTWMQQVALSWLVYRLTGSATLLGAVGFARIVVWQGFGWADYGEHYMALAITVWASLIGVVGFGSTIGSMLPFALHTIGFDPATSSAPFVATLVDVTGLIIYFSIASVILRGLVL